MSEDCTFSTLDDAATAMGLPQGTTIWYSLALGVKAAYDAYPNGGPSLPGYTVDAEIWVQETLNSTEDPYVSRNVGLGSIDGNTFIGFAAHANDYSHNIVILRGTLTAEEVGYDLYGWGTNTACMLPSGNPTQTYGNVKKDLYDFYTGTDYIFTSLAASFNAAVQAVAQINPGKVWLIAAHSLGGALATLGAIDAVVSGSYGSSVLPWLVTFGSLHIGDQSFYDAYTPVVPQTLRFANLCDFVPSLVSLEPDTPTDPYVHVGLEATFVWQTWDDWGNHSMDNIYLPVTESYLNVVKLGPRQYPQ